MSSVTEIIFTPIEVEILVHRLEHLNDSRCLEDLFEEPDYHFDFDRSYAFLERVVKSMKAGDGRVSLDIPEAAEILCDALEGSTFFGVVNDELYWDEISRQKHQAYNKAGDTAAAKISIPLGRDVVRQTV
ncbi:hypothetical protein ACYPKM_05360 [Pseudomonas aeruginosa]